MCNIAMERCAPSSGLAAVYLAMAEDQNIDAKLREAAQLFTEAEMILSESEDAEKAMPLAQKAVDAFKAKGHTNGHADALCLVVAALCIRAEALRYSSADTGPNGPVGETVREAERIMQEELASFDEAKDTRGMASMLWGLADLNSDKRGPMKREEGLEYAKEAVQLCEELDDKELLARVQFTLSVIHVKRHALQDAEKAASKCLALTTEIGLRREQGKAFHMLGLAYHAAFRLQDAVNAAENALAIFRQLKVQRMVALQCQMLASWYIAAGRPREAAPFAREAQTIFAQLDYGKAFQASSLSTMMHALSAKGERVQALKLGQEGLESFRKSGKVREEIVTLDALAQAYFEKDDVEAAERYLNDGVNAAKNIGDKRWEAYLLQSKCQMHLGQRKNDDALEAVQAATALIKEVGTLREEAECMNTEVNVHIANNEINEVLSLAEKQREILQRIGSKHGEATVLMNTAMAHARKDNLDEAMTAATDAQNMFHDICDKHGEACALQTISEVHKARESYEMALQAAKDMEDLAAELQDSKLQLDATKQLAGVFIAKDEPEEATRLLTEARSLTKKHGDLLTDVHMAVFCSQAHIASALKARSQGKKGKAVTSDKAVKCAKEALAGANRLGNRKLRAETLYAVAEASLVHGKLPEAQKVAQQALSAFMEASEKTGEALTTVLMAEIYMNKGEKAQATELANRGMSLAKVAGDSNAEWRAAEVMKAVEGRSDKPAQQQQQEVAQVAEGGAAVEEAAPKEAAKPSVDPELLKKLVKDVTENVLAGDAEDVNWDTPLMDAGLDSLSSVSFRNELSKQAGVPLPAATMFDYPTQAQLVDHLIELSANK